MDTPKIYVADLEAYNSGRLVGKWFDLDDYSSAEELMEAITDYMTSLGKEEYAIHDIENLPRSLYDEYMGEKDFEKIYEILDKAKEMDLPFEVVAEVANEYFLDAVDGFKGKFDDMSDFAYELVEEFGIDSFTSPESYLYVSETDRRIIAGEEGDNYVNDIADEDDGERIIQEADMDLDEYREADEDKRSEMVDKAKEIVSERIYDEWYDGLDDPYYFLVEQMGMYSPEDLKNASFVQVDYDKLGRDLEQDYNTVEYDGDVYVFSQDYAKGGFLSAIFGGGKKKYNRAWHQDHSQVNKKEKWERQDNMRHGKKARNRFMDGGQMSMFMDGGMMAKGGELADVVVYDNGGDSFDRYTIFTPDGSVYGMSENALGFNMYIGDDTEIEKGSHLGKKLKSVPEGIKKAVLERMSKTFAKGGYMARGGEFNRSWHQDHYRVNKAEKWESNSSMRHGKTAHNRYAKGGMTKNAEIIRSFLTSKGEYEVNNLSTHYNQYDDMMLLRNYYTLIATRKGNMVKITAKRFSKSTSTIVNALVAMANDMGFEVSRVEEFAKGGSVGKNYMVFNYTDDIYASNDVFKTKKEANDFIKSFRKRYEAQGYYRDSRMNKIDIEDIDLLAIPSDFNPYKKFAKGGRTKSYKYIPNKDIESITITQGEGSITIPNDNILDGAYIRRRYKAFGRGGNTGNYNYGRSWKADRERFATRQEYEVQYRKHK